MMFFDFLARLFGLAKPVPDPAPVAVQPTKDTGEELVKYYEKCAKKLPNGLIGPYLDRGTSGVPTIGWGSTYYEDGKRVTMDDPPITQARADSLFAHVYGDFRKRVAAVLPVGVAATDLAAFVSLAYNIGYDAFAKSTALSRYKAGDKAGAREALEWWNKDEGVTLKGLQRRRRAERLIMEGVPLASALAQAEKAFP